MPKGKATANKFRTRGGALTSQCRHRRHKPPYPVVEGADNVAMGVGGRPLLAWDAWRNVEVRATVPPPIVVHYGKRFLRWLIPCRRQWYLARKAPVTEEAVKDAGKRQSITLNAVIRPRMYHAGMADRSSSGGTLRATRMTAPYLAPSEQRLTIREGDALPAGTHRKQQRGKTGRHHRVSNTHPEAEGTLTSNDKAVTMLCTAWYSSLTGRLDHEFFASGAT